MPNPQHTDNLLRRLDHAGGQGLALDRLDSPTSVVTALVRDGKAHISFGRLYVTRQAAR